MKLERTLGLTSPQMRGKDVEHAQKMLNSSAPGTRFGNFKPGEVDGVFGQNTAAACKRAKYWLGYATASIKGTYGQQLEDFLGGKELTAEMKKRRQTRLDQAQEVPLRVRAFNKAKAELGTKESPPDTNRCKYTAWYGLVGPWCAMFVTWAYIQAGAKESFRKGQRWASVGFFLTDARGRDWHLMEIGKDQVKQGDLVTFDWEGGGRGQSPWRSDHIGMFDRWVNKGAGIFKTIEGNTAVGNDSNGGEVMRRERKMSQVSAFVRTEV
jgi:CHAP domain